MKAGFFKQVALNDARKVLVVSNMLSKNNESNGNISNSNGSDVLAVNFSKSFERGKEGEVGNPLHILEESEVDNLKRLISGSVTDEGEDSSNHISCKNTDNEGDKLNHLLAENGADHYGDHSNKSANQADPYVSVHYKSTGTCVVCACERVADGVSCKGKTDKGDGGSDNNGGHKFIDPANASEFNYEGDNNINESCKGSTDDDACVTGGNRCGACEGSEHRTKESKGRAEENGALKFSEKLIDQSTDTGAKEGGGLRHTVSYD